MYVFQFMVIEKGDPPQLTKKKKESFSP